MANIGHNGKDNAIDIIMIKIKFAFKIKDDCSRLTA